MDAIKSTGLVFFLFFLCINTKLYADASQQSIFSYQPTINKPIQLPRKRLKENNNTEYTDYYTLKISNPLSIDASVHYKTQDGTAIAGVDYIATSGIATIPTGKTSVGIDVEILIAGTGKTFSLIISNPIGATFPTGDSEISTSHFISNKKIITNIKLLSCIRSELKLTDNVEPTSDQLLSLKSLTCGHKELMNEDIVEIKYLENLEELLLFNNNITSLDAISSLNVLKILNIDENNISDINVLSKLKFLKYLTINYNKISDLRPLLGLKHLENLHLGNNKIESLEGLSNLPVLNNLALQSNKIHDITILSFLTSLKELLLTNNEVTDISPLASLVQPYTLIINRNCISNISILSTTTTVIGFNEQKTDCIKNTTIPAFSFKKSTLPKLTFLSNEWVDFDLLLESRDSNFNPIILNTYISKDNIITADDMSSGDGWKAISSNFYKNIYSTDHRIGIRIPKIEGGYYVGICIAGETRICSTPILIHIVQTRSDMKTFGFQVNLKKIDFGNFYSYQLNINKPNTKDILCYIGKEEKSIINDKKLCTVSDKYSGKVGQHSIDRGSIDHPSGNYFLTIITKENQELHSQLFHLPPKKPKILSILPRYTTLDSVEITLIGEPNTSILVNGNNIGVILPNGKAKVQLDTSGNTGIKEFVIALQDEIGEISQTTFSIKIKKLANIKNIKLSPENILISLKDEVALNDILVGVRGLILNASDYGFDKVLNALITYKDKSTEKLSAIDLGLEISDKNVAKIARTVRQSSKGLSRKIPILKGLQEGSTTLMAKLDDFTSNEINIVVSENTVQDNIPPQIFIHGDNPLNLVIGQTYQEYSAGAIDNIDGVIEVKIQGVVDTTTIGNHEITYTASDKAGNTTTKIRKVIVKKVDSVNPIEILLLPSFSKLTQGDIIALQTEITFPEVGVKNVDDLNIKALMAYAYYEGEFIPKLIPAKNVTLKLSDASIVERSTAIITDKISGKSANIPVLRALKSGNMTITAKIGTTESAPLTIKVAQATPDTTAPIITLKGKAEISLIEGSSFIDEGVTAIDDRDGEVEVRVSGTVDTSIVGSYTLTYTARDKVGNTAKILRKIIVLKNTYIDIDKITNITLGIDNVCREGDTVEILGSSFPQDQLSVTLKFTGKNKKVLSFKALSIQDKKITFICPAQGEEKKKIFFIESSSKKSSIYNIDILGKDSPIIKKIIFNKTNNSLDLYGINLDENYNLYINDIVIDTKNNENNSTEILNITLPKNIKSGYLYLASLNIFSNEQYLSIKSPISGDFSSIKNLNTDNISIWNNGREFNLSNELKFHTNIDFKGRNYISINSGNKSKNYSYLYSTIIFKDDITISVDSLSTAISLTWSGLNVNPYLNKERLKKLRSDISGTKEIKELSSYIDKYISQHGKLDFSDAGIKIKLQSSLKKSYNLFHNNSKKRLSRREMKNNLSPIIQQNLDADVIKVSENKSNRGNLKVLNSTSVPISIRITDFDGIIIQHHTSYDARSLIPLNNINYRNCNLEIITPGVWGNADFKNDISTQLRWNLFLLEFSKHYPDTILFNIFQKEIKNVIQQDYGKSMPYNDVYHLAMDRVKSILQVSSYTPVRIVQILDKFDTIYTITDNLLAAYSVATLSKYINVSVKFPPDIKSITPNKLLINQTTEDGLLHFTIKGMGLNRNLKMKLFQKDAKDIGGNTVDVKVPYYVSGDEMEVSVSLDELRLYYDSHLDPIVSSTRIILSLSVSGFFRDEQDKEIIFLDQIEVNNDLSISTVNPKGGIGGDEIILRGTGFDALASENTVALGHTIEGEFKVKHYLEVKKVEKFTGSDDKITVKIPLNVKTGLYELRSNTFDSIHWSNSVDFKILNMDIDIESIYPNEIDIETNTIVSIFLSCHDASKKIDCNKISKYKEPTYSWDTDWFDKDNFLIYHKNSEFIIEFKGLSRQGSSKYIKSKLVDIQDNGNHLRFKILSKDIINNTSYQEGSLFTTPFVSVRFVMNAENKIKKIANDDAITINQKFGTLGYYDSFERTSSPSSNPKAWESDDGKVGRWDDSLFWSQSHNRYISGFIESGSGRYDETFKKVSKYCNKKGMQLPTYKDFSELIDPSRENLMSPVFKSYFFSTTSYFGSAYWLRNGNRIVQSGSKVYEQDASLFRDKYVYHTEVKCIQ